MATTIFEYQHTGPAEAFFTFYPHLISRRASFILCAVGLAFGIFLARQSLNHRKAGILLEKLSLILPGICLTAMFFHTWGYVDEVSINLQHPYNLFHHGLFSMSPFRMVDGTVEHLYYLLLTPFAATQKSLVTANLALGLVIAWLHLWLLWRFFRDKEPALKLLLLTLFSVYYPLIRILSCGFGNSLVSLMILAAILAHLEGKILRSWLIASILPLLRPDGILYSFGILAASADRQKKYPLRKKAVLWVLPLASLFIYMSIHRSAYGHWIPTPVRFKALTISSLRLFDSSVFLHQIRAWLAEPAHIIFAAAAIFAFFDAKTPPALKILRAYLALTGLILIFYTIARSTLGDFSYTAYSRYWVGFELTLLVVFAELISGFAGNRQGQGGPALLRDRRFMPAFSAALATLLVAGHQEAQHLQNREGLSLEGQIIDRIAPSNFSIATSEMGTFGLMIENREVIDLWGYTTPGIARSGLYNNYKCRISPSFFLQKGPDLCWLWGNTASYEDAEQFLAMSSATEKKANLLGDMRAVLDKYHVLILRRGNLKIMCLVKKESWPALEESMSRNNYSFTRNRDVDLETFGRWYDGQALDAPATDLHAMKL